MAEPERASETSRSPECSPEQMKIPRATTLRVTALVWCGLMSGCSSSSPTPLGNAGEWAGTTAHGSPISFTVSQDEKVTLISIGYNFNGCVGSKTFSNLDLGTVPNVSCTPGPCTPPVSTYRAFSYSEGGLAFSVDPSPSVNGFFPSPGSASGAASFWNYPGCGTANGVPWTATRR